MLIPASYLPTGRRREVERERREMKFSLASRWKIRSLIGFLGLGEKRNEIFSSVEMEDPVANWISRTRRGVPSAALPV
ncbi:hypothetical protein QE152_g5049 [Popillia japonica]|uniref:Uncharacterized protein n=1 Tax=Popillia japonica TaxID=7064 RepID=A0AAW1MQK1_POPJA